MSLENKTICCRIYNQYYGSNVQSYDTHYKNVRGSACAQSRVDCSSAFRQTCLTYTLTKINHDLYSFSNLGARQGWVVNDTYWPLYQREIEPVPNV